MPIEPFENPLDPFESPKELIEGAKERFAELEPICQAVSEVRDYEIVSHSDPNTGDKVVKIRLKKRFSPKIRRLASSILKELRVALDQAFCEAAVALGRANAKGIYFPFGKSLDDLNVQIADKCRNVDRRLVDYCLSYKPYLGGNSDGILWSMSKLAGETHRFIVGAAFQDTGSFLLAVTGYKGPLQIVVNKWNSLHNELEVARVPPGSELHVNPNFTLRMNIIFAGGTYALAFRPLLQSLDHLIRVVDGIILGIEAETRRLTRL